MEGARLEGRVVLGGRSDPEQLRIEPTVVAVREPQSDPLMAEELFGPVLPLLLVFLQGQCGGEVVVHKVQQQLAGGGNEATLVARLQA